jgi:hypothetical protein
MLLAAMALALVPMLQTEARDGVFVGTLITSDPALLLVRADSGDEVTFLIDPQSNVPPGFVRGNRVAVRFEVLPDGRYRVASVSPPRIPSEPDAVSTLPRPPEAAPSPADAPRAELGASAVRAASEDRASEPVPAREGVTRARRSPAASPPSAPPGGVAEVAASPIPGDATGATAEAASAPGGLPGGWLAVTAGLLAAAILIALARRRE